MLKETIVNLVFDTLIAACSSELCVFAGLETESRERARIEGDRVMKCSLLGVLGSLRLRHHFWVLLCFVFLIQVKFTQYKVNHF